MTLTPEQFNKLATKEDLKNLKERVASRKDMDNVLAAVDSVVKKLDDIEHVFVSNLAAHDRFEKRIARIEEHLSLNPLFNA